MNSWWAIGDHHELARSKGIALTSFEKYTLRSISPYWNDFVPVLEKLRKAIWPEPCAVTDQKNVATHEQFFCILDDARKLYQKQAEVPLEYAYIADWPASGIGATSSNNTKGKRKIPEPAPLTPRKRSSTTKRGGAT